MKTIKVIDTNDNLYDIEPNFKFLSRQYDNNAETISVEIPEVEANSTCTVIIETVDREVIDHIALTQEHTFSIGALISNYPAVLIGVSFERTDDSIKNSAFRMFSFPEALDPTASVPITPEQSASIDTIKNHAFADVEEDATTPNKFNFKNYVGTLVDSITITVQQEQADLDETDTTKNSYVKGKKTSNLTNDSGFIDKDVSNLTNYTKTSDLPTKLSDFTNDSGFITSTVDNLTNYYKKSETYTQGEVNSLVASIKTITVEIVATLPTADATTYFNTSKKIYLVLANNDTTDSDFYNEYITIRAGAEGSYTYSWEKIGDTRIDLSGYVPTSRKVNNKPLTSDITLSSSDVGALPDDTYIPTKTSDLTNDSGFLTSHQDISGKEDTSNKVTSLSSSSTDTQYPSAKAVYDNLQAQKPIVASNITASTWVADSTYSDYGYKCELAVTGVTSSDIAEVIFGQTEAVSGNYANVCLTSTGTVTIYSKVNTSITIPTILVIRGGVV